MHDLLCTCRRKNIPQLTLAIMMPLLQVGIPSCPLVIKQILCSPQGCSVVPALSLSCLISPVGFLHSMTAADRDCAVQQWSGVNAVSFFSPQIFVGAQSSLLKQLLLADGPCIRPECAHKCCCAIPQASVPSHREAMRASYMLRFL